MTTEYTTIQVSQDGAFLIATCMEKTIGLGAPELGWADEMNDVLKNMKSRLLIIDFTHVNVISSSVIQYLIRVLFSSKKQGYRFALCGLRKDIQHTLKMMRISNLFTIARDIEDAKSALEKQS